jgi:hypothetical protein
MLQIAVVNLLHIELVSHMYCACTTSAKNSTVGSTL